jgi:hypothetical protein
MDGIPVFVGPYRVEYAKGRRLEQLMDAPNAAVVRRRKDGRVMQINLCSFGSDFWFKPFPPKGDPRNYSHDNETKDNPPQVWTLRHLRSQDRSLYRQSLLDCLKQEDAA